MPRIYVIGALVYDIIFNVADWPQPHRAVHASHLTLSPGGKALNQATTARLLGGDVSLIGCVGDDSFGCEVLDALRQLGVNVDHVRVHETARTSLASVLVRDRDSVAGFIGAPDASRMLTVAQIRAALAQLTPGDILVVDFEIQQHLVQCALSVAKEAGALAVLNPAPFFTHDDFVVDYLHLADVIIPNKLEAQLIAGVDTDDHDELGRLLLSLGVKQVVMTLGGAGCVLHERDRSLAQRAFEVDVVDTTGASDAFIGAYCMALQNKCESAAALRFATAAGGLACSRHGTMTAMPSLSEIRALLRAGEG